jgi:hypothetical protein
MRGIPKEGLRHSRRFWLRRIASQDPSSDLRKREGHLLPQGEKEVCTLPRYPVKILTIRQLVCALLPNTHRQFRQR